MDMELLIFLAHPEIETPGKSEQNLLFVQICRWPRTCCCSFFFEASPLTGGLQNLSLTEEPPCNMAWCCKAWNGHKSLMARNVYCFLLHCTATAAVAVTAEWNFVCSKDNATDRNSNFVYQTNESFH